MYRAEYAGVGHEAGGVPGCCTLPDHTGATRMNYREEHPLQGCAALAPGGSGRGACALST